VNTGVTEEGEHPEGRPQQRIRAEESGHRAAAAGSTGGRGGEHPHQRQAGGQHHRRDHHLPGEQETDEAQPERGAAVDQRVVVHGRRGAGQLGGDRRRPGGGDRGGDRERHPVRAGRGNRRVPAHRRGSGGCAQAPFPR
jgi:hypothetical protein